MALSESGLAAQGITPGPMIYGPKGSRITVRPKSSRNGGGSRTTNFYVTSKSSKGRARK